MALPMIITSSVIRGADQGDSHGGVYLIDLEKDKVKKVLDWNTTDIDWAGRGGDRGLRGIALFEDKVYMAASDEIYVFDRKFRMLSSIRHPLLKHCHETFLDGSLLYITSTGFNAVLVLDLESEDFVGGQHFEFSKLGAIAYKRGFPAKPKTSGINMNEPEGYSLVGENSLHINNVQVLNGALYFSSTLR